jgi:peptidoglycan DL-endopeptidase CwlO
LWGGTGPDEFDCSGLTQDAYAAQGVSIPRTSQDQWAAGPQTSSPKWGDLVFFAGVDGTSSAPGHVGIYLSPDEMIDAYGSGTVVRTESFGLSSSAGGLQDVVGYTDPR